MLSPQFWGDSIFQSRKEKVMQEKQSKTKSILLESLIIVIILALSLLSYFLFFYSTDVGSSIIIEGDQKVIGEYDLNTERLILIEKSDNGYTLTEIEQNYNVSDFKPHYNLVSIKDGAVSVIEADCPATGVNRCTNQGKKTYSGHSIICLENGIVITIIGGEEDDELDFVSK